MKTRLTILLSAAAMAFASLASAKEWTTIRIGVDPTYPPFESTATDGSVKGFDIDLGNALCAKLKAKCVWVSSSFDGLIPGLQARKFDVILSSMAATEQRRQQIDFTDRLYRNQTRLIARTGSGLLPDAAKLAGKRVAVEQGTIQETYAREKWAAAKVEVVPYPSYDQAYADLVTGRVDGVLMDAVQGQLGFLATPRGTGFSFAGAWCTTRRSWATATRPACARPTPTCATHSIAPSRRFAATARTTRSSRNTSTSTCTGTDGEYGLGSVSVEPSPG